MPAPPPPTTAHAARRAVFGRARHDTGEPADGARIAVGRQRTHAGPDGAFRLDSTNDDDALVATLAGCEPAVVDAVARHPDVEAGRQLEVVLRRTALTIRGVLVGVDGGPCPGWNLCLHGGTTPAGHDGLPELSAEDFAAGAKAVEAPVADERDLLSGKPRQHNPNHRIVGDDGAFVVAGLRPGRHYVLRAWNESTLQTVLSSPVAAGTQGYRFVVPPGEWRDRAYGRAIDRHGGPIAGVRVRLTMRVHDNGSGHTSYQTGQEVRTDADGRFAFQRVPREDLLLRFDGPDVESLYREFPAAEAGLDLLVPLACRLRFRIEPTPALPVPTSVLVLDAAHKPLRLEQQIAEGTSRGGERMDLPASGVAEFTVGDAAAWLVLERDGAELRRLPLQLRRGEIAIVRG
ncbi:MAG: carboxypeptidase regulatory-like domain-containing protein [Planctomycetes bacterium]|nr:carboxypeptidase regulatory-like domain-containing protein [Planctomycetota bacterium]